MGFGKVLESLRNPRIDLISISGHKLFAPKGVGALVMRKRGYKRTPIQPLIFGGGQERGVRPGTLPVALVAALGKAAEVAVRDHAKRKARCRAIRESLLESLSKIECVFSGDQSRAMDHAINLSIGCLDSEALIVALKNIVSISNGSACTSASYTPSHVLTAMGMSEEEANRCIRISWCHMTPDVDWGTVVDEIRLLM